MQTTSSGSGSTTTLMTGSDRSLPEHINGANEEALSFESNVIPRRPKTDRKQMEYRDDHLLEFGKELCPEDPGRTTPESLDSRNEDYFDDDDGQSSVCSDMVFCGRGGGGGWGGGGVDAASSPAKYSTLDRNFRMRKAGSLVEALEKRRRESVGNRLKELHKTTTNRRTSLFSAIDEMPVIAKRSPSGENLLPLLPRQTRRASYQSVIAGPFLQSQQLFGSAAQLDRLERRNSVTGGGGPRGQTPTTRPYFPLRAAESLSGWENFVVEPSSERFSSVQGRRVPSQLDGDRGASSNGLSAIDPIEATTRCNDDNNDDTVKSDDRRIIIANDDDDDDSDTKRFGFGEDPAESNGETERRRRKEYEEKNDEAEGVPAVPSIPNEGSSCEGIASTEDFSDNRINGSSSSSSSLSLGTNDGSSHAAGPRDIETPDSVQSHEDHETTEAKQSTCSSKADENPADIGVCVAEVTHRSRSAAPKTDEAVNMNKASDGDACIVVKGDSYSPKGKKKYYSDIRIQLKETHSPTSRNYGANENSSMQNGNSPAAAPNEREDDDDDDDDDDDGESDSSEMAKNIAPNWSSYPGPLLNNSNFEDEAIDIPKRNISTLEINVNCANSDDSDRSDDRSNAFRSEQTTPSTNADDQVSGKNRIRDSDLSYCSHVYLRRDVKERFAGPEDPPQASVGFYGNRPNASQGLDGNCATERREIFLVESRSVTERTKTLPRDQRSRNPNNARGGSCNGGFPQGNISPASQNGGRRENGTPCGPETLLSRTDAARTFCSQREGAGLRADDQMKTRPATTVNGGLSESSSVMHMKSPDDQRTDRGSYRLSSSSSSDTQQPPSSVERIWESVEEPRPRTLRRKIRFELDSGSLPPASENSQRRSRSSSSGCDPAKGAFDNDDRTMMMTTTTMMMTRSLSTEENGVRHGNSSSSSVPEATSGEHLLLNIDVPKGGLGLGFCIEGGKDGPYGDRPITVKRLFRVSSDPKASCASEATLRPGDEIISANGREMALLSRYVAWNYLKTLPEGTIKLVIRRRQQ